MHDIPGSHNLHVNASSMLAQIWPTVHCSLSSFLFSIFIALIPLSEFSEPVITKKYGVKPDAETLDMLNTVARQKEVIT